MKSRAILFLAFLSAGCSRTFIPTPFERLKYESEEVAPGVEFGYRLAPLWEAGNRKLDDIALHEGFEIVAVKVANRSESPLVLREGLEFVSNGIRLDLVPADTVVQWVYLQRDYDKSGVLPLAPVPSLVHNSVSNHRRVKRNREFAQEITGKDLEKRTLQPGDQAMGYLIFKGAIKRKLIARARAPRRPGVPAMSNPDTP